MNEMNEFLNRLSKEEFGEFIGYCNAMYYDKFQKVEIEDKFASMKRKLVEMRANHNLGPTGHGDICMSDADNGL